MGRLLLALVIITLNQIAHGQETTLESCGTALYKAKKNVYDNDVARKSGLKSLTSASLLSLRKLENDWSDCVRNKSIPNLSFTTIDCKKFNDSNLRGKVLVINFWFKSCAPCVAEMPALNKLRNEFKGRDVVFIGFSTDAEHALKADYLNSSKFLFNIVSNSGDVADKFYFDGFPTTYIVDQNGKVVKAWTGYAVGLADPYSIAKPLINRLLARKRKDM
ncbi:Thiol-disulfide isomerase or thioredoxin [Dyadobacter soli]|uniref:Thiol-disulfide isomerase or thioredoxin n=1 Tax=Dyadobacter soli TaxID=659014 RepID=A0A1G6VRJ6_9BACT|nr:TlpA disulfide reductase family protein [Dyadobacter soli]SDD56171.1 Thiol-disulfide isomerase or thioredoxin [Dyadobacter soli]